MGGIYDFKILKIRILSTKNLKFDYHIVDALWAIHWSISKQNHNHTALEIRNCMDSQN